MPTRERVSDFVARMMRDESLELMVDFYAEDASAQENCEPPRVGLAALQAHEKAALERMRFEKIEAASVIVDGDRVAINWVFDLVVIDGGQRIHFDEIALQEWRGDRIVRERFYYDPAQRRPAKPKG